MGSEGSHSTQDDTPLAYLMKQRKRKGKSIASSSQESALQDKADELEAQNNKIAMKNEVLQEQCDKLLKALHEARQAQTREPVTPVETNRQHRRARASDIEIPGKKRGIPRLNNQHETSPDPVNSTQDRRSRGRRLNTEGTGDSETSRSTHPGSQYSKSRKEPHTLNQAFLLPRGEENLRKKAPRAHDSPQNPLVLQLVEEVNKLKAGRRAGILDWNQPGPGPLTRRILNTPLQAKTRKKLGLQLYTGKEDPIEHLNLFESTMTYRMHTDEERCLLFPSTLSGGALNWYCRLESETVNSFEDLRKKFVSQHIFQTDRLHSADDLYAIHQKPDESLRMYAGRFSHEYSRCAEADDKTALKAFTIGLRDCIFKYMINANTWKTYSEVMAQAYNHASAEAKTYQQQVGSGSQNHPIENTSSLQTAMTPPHAMHNASPSQRVYQPQSKKNKRHHRNNQEHRHDNTRFQAVNAVIQTRDETPPTPSPTSLLQNRGRSNKEKIIL